MVDLSEPWQIWSWEGKVWLLQLEEVQVERHLWSIPEARSHGMPLSNDKIVLSCWTKYQHHMKSFPEFDVTLVFLWDASWMNSVLHPCCHCGKKHFSKDDKKKTSFLLWILQGDFFFRLSIITCESSGMHAHACAYGSRSTASGPQAPSTSFLRQDLSLALSSQKRLNCLASKA